MNQYWKDIKREVSLGHVSEIFLDNLVLFKYTQVCFKKRAWNPTNLSCRGLVCDTTTQIVVGRPFNKFFNLNEPGRPENTIEALQKKAKDTPWVMSNKFDGSMITFFFHENEWKSATTGSLNSPQAEEALKLLKSTANLSQMGPNLSYICEYIAPWNRVVVDYGDVEKLVLLSVHSNSFALGTLMPGTLHKEGERIGLEAATPIAGTLFPYISNNEEGCVILFQDGHRVKFKSDWYLAAHKLRDYSSARTITKAVREGLHRQYLDGLLPERREIVGKQMLAVERMHDETVQEINNLWTIITIQLGAHPASTEYKQIAAHINKFPEGMRAPLFARMRGKVKAELESTWKETERRISDDW